MFMRLDHLVTESHPQKCRDRASVAPVSTQGKAAYGPLEYGSRTPSDFDTEPHSSFA
jgi:hypothetical protein